MAEDIGQDEVFEYVISESVLAHIASTATLGTKGVAGPKGKGIFVKNTDGDLCVEVHIRAWYGTNLRTLALTVQQNVTQGINAMMPPQKLSVHVTIEDLSMEKPDRDSTGG